MAKIKRYLPVFPSPALPVRSSDERAKTQLALLDFDTLFLALSILASSAIVRRDLCKNLSQLTAKPKN